MAKKRKAKRRCKLGVNRVTGECLRHRRRKTGGSKRKRAAGPVGDPRFRDIIAYARSGRKLGCDSKEREDMTDKALKYMEDHAKLEAKNLTSAAVSVRRHNAIAHTSALIRKILKDSCLPGGIRKRATSLTPHLIRPFHVSYTKPAAAKKPAAGAKAASSTASSRLTIPAAAPTAAGQGSWGPRRRTSVPVAPPVLPSEAAEAASATETDFQKIIDDAKQAVDDITESSARAMEEAAQAAAAQLEPVQRKIRPRPRGWQAHPPPGLPHGAAAPITWLPPYEAARAASREAASGSAPAAAPWLPAYAQDLPEFDVDFELQPTGEEDNRRSQSRKRGPRLRLPTKKEREKMSQNDPRQLKIMAAQMRLVANQIEAELAQAEQESGQRTG